MQFGAESVVLLENGQQIAREVIQILLVYLTNNRTVDRHVARIIRFGAVDEDVARVHVGVEKAVAKYLSEENLHAPLGQ